MDGKRVGPHLKHCPSECKVHGVRFSFFFSTSAETFPAFVSSGALYVAGETEAGKGVCSHRLGAFHKLDEYLTTLSPFRSPPYLILNFVLGYLVRNM